MKKLLLVLPIALIACTVDVPTVSHLNISDVDFEELKYQKTGTSCNTIVLGIIPLEYDKSIAKTAWRAGITKVSYVEKEVLPLWPLVYQSCVVVYGE